MSDLRERKKALQVLLVDSPGAYTGLIDGVLGEKSDAAWQRVRTSAEPTPAIANSQEESSSLAPAIRAMLQPNAWPLEEDAANFYGTRPNLTHIKAPWPMRMFDSDARKWLPIQTITCHVKVAASLRRIFAAVLAHYGSAEAIRAAGMDVFDGAYAPRNVRGSSTKISMHAYGAAVDFNSERWPLGSSGRMPQPVLDIFHAESWRTGESYKGRKDPMHAEACA